MNQNILKIMGHIESALNNSGVELKSRPKVITMALAKVVSAKLEIPSSPLEISPASFYREQHAGMATQMICELNEHIMCDVREAERLASEFWRFRYELVHTPLSSRCFKAFVEVADEKLPTYEEKELTMAHDLVKVILPIIKED